MKENQIDNSNSCQREADQVLFSSNDSCFANGYGRNTDPLASGVSDGHNFWSSEPKCSEVLENWSNCGGSPTVEDQDGSLCNLNGPEKSDRSLGPDHKDKEETKSTADFGQSMIDDEVMNWKEKESDDSEIPCTTTQSVMQLYTDKNVVECELPELVVCYREPCSHVVKDICVDEGVPKQEKLLIENDKDGHAGSSVSHPPTEDTHPESRTGLLMVEHIPDKYGGLSVENMKENPVIECIVNHTDTACSVLVGPRSSEDIGCRNLDKAVCSETLGQTDETNRSTSGKAENDVLENLSVIGSPCNSQEFVVQNSQKGPSDSDNNKAAQQHEEIPPIETILESLAMAFSSEESKKCFPVSNLCYNSKVDGGTITFDFNSTKPAVASDMDGGTEVIHEKVPKSEDSHLDHTLASIRDQCAKSAVKSNEEVHEQNPQSHDITNHENWNSGNLLVSGQVQLGEGETSFSASGPVSGLVSNSGPIPYSGSISLRSDSSTTSARSFAFPVLQSEWISSPVRMRKADRRHLRKHRGWMHGLFCCRF